MDTAASGPDMGLLRIDELHEWQRKLDVMPELPWRIIASDRMPYDRIAQMYDTKGRKLVYANREQVKSIPKPKLFSPVSIHDFGIPVVFE